MPNRRQQPMTRADQRRWNSRGIGLLVSIAVAWSFGAGLAGLLRGQGWHPALPYLRHALLVDAPGSLVGVHHAQPLTWWIPCAFLIGAAGGTLVTLATRTPGEERHRGLANWSQVRHALSARTVRRAGKFTRPDLAKGELRRAPLTELGYRVGHMRGHRRQQLWAQFEYRVRIIARTGWGKTSRLLVWIARELPGAALIASTAPDLFEQTVRARQDGPRMPRGRRFWTRWFWRPGHGPGHRVLVVDFSERANRYAAGFERVHWNPIPGCEDWQVALRRARALVAGAEDGNRTDSRDEFFRDSATEVVAAWWHAAALGGRTMADVVKWMRSPLDPEPKDIIDTHPAAQRVAWQALDTHLDPEGERTTSSVKRFVLLALAPFATDDGDDFVGGHAVDLAELIVEQATIYLLASASTAPSVAPVLTMFADEWIYTARSVAITRYPQYGRRLPVPAVAVLDELRALVPIPSLPEVAYEMRKYGIGAVWSVQNGDQEEELYGKRAVSLRQNTQLTILGGYDPALVDELIAQAGPVAVTAPSASGSVWAPVPDISDGTQWRDVLTANDLQTLKDGDGIARMAGVSPFFMHVDSFRSWRHPLLRRRIHAEERSVRRDVAVAQAVAGAEHESWLTSARASYERRAR